MTAISEQNTDDARVVLVTGGSRGIGRAVVLRMARTGARIAFTYATREDSARETAQAARDAGAAEVIFLPCDMADAGAVTALPGQVRARWGRLDVLVNNAGLTRDGPFALLSAAQWSEVLTVNLVNTIRLTEAALPLLQQSGGCVISVASLAGRTGKEGQVPYSATKSGVIGMTRLIARAGRHSGVRAAAVLPGFVNTDMIAGLDDRAMGPTLAGSVLGRAAEPDDVAGACVFLADRDAACLPGAILPVDGGFRI